MATTTHFLSVSAGRLASIAYHCVGIQTEAGAAPYTRIVNAGGVSGLSVGVAQNDFTQHPTSAPFYSQKAEFVNFSMPRRCHGHCLCQYAERARYRLPRRNC